MGSCDGTFRSVDRRTGSSLWTTRAGTGSAQSFFGVKGTVRAVSGSADALYVGTMEGNLYAISPAPSCRVE